MKCGKKTKPNFTKEFIVANCGTVKNRLCKHSSKQVKWCQLFGTIQKSKYPGIATMAKSLVKAGAKHIASGGKQRSLEEQKKCMEICNTCDRFVKEAERCTACGCKMKRKIKWATTICNLGKW